MEKLLHLTAGRSNNNCQYSLRDKIEHLVRKCVYDTVHVGGEYSYISSIQWTASRQDPVDNVIQKDLFIGAWFSVNLKSLVICELNRDDTDFLRWWKHPGYRFNSLSATFPKHS
jgi:hypothetical protein